MIHLKEEEEEKEDETVPSIPTVPITTKRKRGRPPACNPADREHYHRKKKPPSPSQQSQMFTDPDLKPNTFFAIPRSSPIEEQYHNRVQEMKKKKKKEQSKIRKDLNNTVVDSTAVSPSSVSIPRVWIEHIISSLDIAVETKLLKYPTVASAIKKYLESVTAAPTTSSAAAAAEEKEGEGGEKPHEKET